MNLKRLRGNLYESYVLGLIVLGLPLVGLIYGGWREAVTVFILVNIGLGVLALRSSE
jgi:hypothetical protein